jgi:hypothetical protein
MPMQEFQVTLDADDVALLGTANQGQAEATLAMLAEIALAELPEQLLLKADNDSD